MIAFIGKNIELSDLQILLNLKNHGFEGMGIIDVASIKSCKKLVFTSTSCLDARLNDVVGQVISYVDNISV